MTLLERYVWNTMNAKGIQHKVMLEGLRSYLKTVDLADFEFAINRINRIDQFKTMWEAGLTMSQQRIVMRRYEELGIRREER